MAHTAEAEKLLPTEPVDAVIDPFKRFLHIESASGIILFIAAVTAIVLANSPLAEGFLVF